MPLSLTLRSWAANREAISCPLHCQVMLFSEV